MLRTPLHPPASHGVGGGILKAFEHALSPKCCKMLPWQQYNIDRDVVEEAMGGETNLLVHNCDTLASIRSTALASARAKSKKHRKRAGNVNKRRDSVGKGTCRGCCKPPFALPVEWRCRAGGCRYAVVRQEGTPERRIPPLPLLSAPPSLLAASRDSSKLGRRGGGFTTPAHRINVMLMLIPNQPDVAGRV